MPLIWTFSFLRVHPETSTKPEIQTIASFLDGKPQFIATAETAPEIVLQMESVITLLSYLAFFPGKDFIKIKLSTQSSQTALHFLDKRFLSQNFLGVLSIIEISEAKIFDSWGVEEMMSEYIFEYYQDSLTGKTEIPFDIADFYVWLANQVEDFYHDRQDTKNNLPISNSSNSKLGIKQENKNTSEMETTQEIFPSKEHWWDIVLINEFGQPLTEMLTFIDKTAFSFSDETENISQNLESMSISALKILLDQQGAAWNIEYLKSKLQNEMGYQYTFFKKFNIGAIRYLLIMNSSIYDLEAQQCIPIFRGNEFYLLDQIASRIKLKSDLFNDIGQFHSTDSAEKIRQLILQCVENI